MTRDVILNKTEVIQRCLQRIEEVYGHQPANLRDFTKQDSIVLNLQRACEACIDLAMHLVAVNRWGIPQSSRDAFEFLFKHDVLDRHLTDRMKAMVGFRNVAVHDYQSINLAILQNILDHHLDDFRQFSKAVLKQVND
jgi:uncharacterized protein YutE (UPF0331/DUF86 family)